MNELFTLGTIGDNYWRLNLVILPLTQTWVLLLSVGNWYLASFNRFSILRDLSLLDPSPRIADECSDPKPALGSLVTTTI
jgi:hypothetical protein